MGLQHTLNWQAKNKEKVKQHKLKYELKQYGLTIDQYNQLVIDQNNKCLICNNEELKRGLSVDHCHKTNKIRGLLCSKCNIAIGLLNDSPDLCIKAMQYLQNTKIT